MTGVSLFDERGEQLIPSPGLQFAVISVAAAQTDSELVAAVTGAKIRVLGFFLTVGGTAAVTVLFESGTATAISGVMDVGSTAVERQLSYAGSSNSPAFETALGAALTVTNVGAGGTLRGFLAYVEVAG